MTPRTSSRPPARSKPARKRSSKRVHDLTRIEPRAFFEEFLVDRYAEGLARAAAPPGYDLAVRVELSGPGGGVWVLGFDDHALTVERGRSSRRIDVQVCQSVDDWAAFVRGELGGPSALVAEASRAPAPVVPLDATSRERLRRIDGTLVVSIRHFQGRDWQLGIHFGASTMRKPPDTTFSMSWMDFQSLTGAGRPANLQALMLGGALRIEGNFALAGELAAIVTTHLQATLARIAR